MMKYSIKTILGSTVFFALLLSSACQVSTSYFHKQVPVPELSWDYTFQPGFKLEIEDTTAYYQMYFLFRHDDAFPYANLWFRLHVKGPGDSTFSEGPRIEKELADTEGKWLGKGMGNIWEHRIPLRKKEIPALNRPGVYEIKIEQIMRTNPLPSVLHIGLQVEKLYVRSANTQSGDTTGGPL